MVCFEEYYVKFDVIVDDAVSGEKLDRFLVFHEGGEERARFALPQSEGRTRWEIRAAAQDALHQAEREARLRRRAPKRLELVA